MAASSIEWTDKVWNPVRGCVKVSAGCKHCYAETFAERWRGVPGHAYEQGFDLRLVPEKLEEPLGWKKPARIFVNSMSDLFQDGVPEDFIARVFSVMGKAERHTFQILTKRPERMRQMLTSPRWAAMKPLPNVWLGVSVEDQMTADERIPLLLDTPAAIRWISAEPLLGPLDLDRIEAVCSTWRKGLTIGTYLDWVVVGGESGPGARPFHLNWAHDLIDQCRAAGVPVFVKQVGARPVIDRDDSRIIRDRKGGDMSEWPSSIRIREFPRPVAVPA